MELTIPTQTGDEEPPKVEEKQIPSYGTIEWIEYWSELEGHLPTPINVSITGSLVYKCPELQWFNFDVCPHKVKLSNTGYTLIISSKWKMERPYLTGGPFLEKHVLSTIHFHWGEDMMKGSDHTVDERSYPVEMQMSCSLKYPTYGDVVYRVAELSYNMVELSDAHACGMLVNECCLLGLVTFFRSEYLTQKEALHHPDGVTMVCYLIKYGVLADERLSWIIEGFPRVKEAQTNTKIGPYPMSHLLPMFFEDYFLYWGKLETVKGENFVIKWVIPRTSLSANFEQLREFRKLWGPWDEPNLRNFRPVQERGKRHVLFVNPHWSQHNSLLPTARVPEHSISLISPAYLSALWSSSNATKSGDNVRSLKGCEILSRLQASQSPIAISLNQCPQWSSLDPLEYQGYWDSGAYGTLVNTGYTANFKFEPEVRPTLSGGPLVEEYIFEQMYFHWSVDNHTGCEHLLDGHGYAVECQVVHYNSKYGSMQAAVVYPDGLSVVGLFLEAKEVPNPMLDKLVEGFRKIKKNGNSVRVSPESLAWMNFDDLQGNYVTYKGSLTTPPYTECVTWIIYEKPVTIGIEQLGPLRQLEAPDQVPIKRNVRPMQDQPPRHAVIFVKQVK